MWSYQALLKTLQWFPMALTQTPNKAYTLCNLPLPIVFSFMENLTPLEGHPSAIVSLWFFLMWNNICACCFLGLKCSSFLWLVNTSTDYTSLAKGSLLLMFLTRSGPSTTGCHSLIYLTFVDLSQLQFYISLYNFFVYADLLHQVNFMGTETMIALYSECLSYVRCQVSMCWMNEQMKMNG